MIIFGHKELNTQTVNTVTRLRGIGVFPIYRAYSQKT